MIKALLFDINGTLIDILTDEGREEIYRTLSTLLDYQGIKLYPEELREVFWRLNKKQRSESGEEYPEFDAIKIFETIIQRYATEFTRSLPPEQVKMLPVFLAQTFRAASLVQLNLYPYVRVILDELSDNYTIAAVSDGQSIWALPELHSVGLTSYFSKIIISSDLGYRKPDVRIFQQALEALKLTPREVLFIGNDMYRDVLGPYQLGIKTIYFKSNQGDQTPHGVKPDYVIHEFKQLLQAVRHLAEKAEQEEQENGIEQLQAHSANPAGHE